MIKTFNWQVLGNKCEIYLFTKEMKKKEKKGNTIDMTLGNLSFHRKFLNRNKVRKYDMIFEIYFVSIFKKILFVVKLS